VVGVSSLFLADWPQARLFLFSSALSMLLLSIAERYHHPTRRAAPAALVMSFSGFAMYRFLEALFPPSEVGLQFAVMIASLMLTVSGAGLAWFRPEDTEEISPEGSGGAAQPSDCPTPRRAVREVNP